MYTEVLCAWGYQLVFPGRFLLLPTYCCHLILFLLILLLELVHQLFSIISGLYQILHLLSILKKYNHILISLSEKSGVAIVFWKIVRDGFWSMINVIHYTLHITRTRTRAREGEREGERERPKLLVTITNLNLPNVTVRISEYMIVFVCSV